MKKSLIILLTSLTLISCETWNEIDAAIQRDPAKFNEAVRRFGRSVFDSQNIGKVEGNVSPYVTDWGKHIDAFTDVYDPYSQYNIDKRARQRMYESLNQ